jgi:DNA-binding transcriptional regulator YiaG
MTIQQKINKIKKKLKLSDEQLGAKLNVSSRAVNRWRRGIAKPQPYNVVQIDRLYDELFGND